MADHNTLYFKVYCDILTDLATSELSNDDMGFIVRLWALIKKERQEPLGSITFRRPATVACAMLHVPDFDSLVSKIGSITAFRNMASHVTEDQRHFSVTFSKWLKHQGDRSAERTARWRERQRSERETCDAYILSSSISSSSVTGIKERVQGKPSRDPEPANGNGHKPADLTFAQFWKDYPRKEAKPRAASAWNKQRCAGALELILADIDRRKASGEWEDPKYIPLPASYLNARRWEDEGIQLPNGPDNPACNTCHDQPYFNPQTKRKEVCPECKIPR